MVKVVTIAAFVVLGASLLLTGKLFAQYTTQGGFFPRGYLAPLLAMTFSIYAFGGVEFVAVTSGESRSLHEVAKAVRITFVMLMILYLGAIAILVGVMPWNRRRRREPVRNCVSLGAHSRGQPPDELRGADGGLVGGKRGTLRFVPHVVLDGPDWLGSGGAWEAELARLADAGSAGLGIRNRRCARSGKIGRRECLRVHLARGIFRHDACPGWCRWPRMCFRRGVAGAGGGAADAIATGRWGSLSVSPWSLR